MYEKETAEFSTAEFVNRLTAEIAESRRDIEPFRNTRRERWIKYAGHNYAPGGEDEPVPRNLIAQQVNILGRYLESGSPQCVMSTYRRELWPEAYDFEAAANRDMQRMGVADVFNEATRDALIGGLAVVKVGWDGRPYCYNVDLDNLVLDMQAARLSEMDYVGDRYMLPLTMVRESPQFDRAVTAKIGPHIRTQYINGTRRQSSIGGGQRARDPIIDTVNLVDVFLPRYGVLLTLEDDPSGGGQPSGKLLRCERWKGPDHGPYRMLFYFRVAGNVFPLAPSALIEDIHDAVNVVARKEADRAQAYAEITWSPMSSAKDADSVMRAGDGYHVNLEGQSGEIRKFVRGGATAQGTLFVQDWMNAGMEEGGALRVIGGVGPQADTATQEQLLSQSASKFVDTLQERATLFLRDIIGDVSWYRWHSDERMQVARQIGTQTEVFWFGPAQKHLGEWDDFEIDVDPYNMRNRSPVERLRAVDKIVRELFIPAEAQLARAGWGLDWKEITNVYKKALDAPEVDRLLKPISATGLAKQSEEDASAASATSTRTYIRKNQGANAQKQENTMTRQAALTAMSNGNGDES